MLLYAVILALIAGAMNGSYVTFLKYIQLSNNFIWAVFAIFAFGIAPWIALFLFGQHIFALFNALSIFHFLVLIIGGILFSLGMVLFVFALKYVGMSVSFILNIAAGTIVGTLLPVLLLNPQKLLTLAGFIQLFALFVFSIALYCMLKASGHRESHLASSNTFKGKNVLGVLVGSLSGILTSAQGFVYSYSLPSVLKIAIMVNTSNLTATLMVWAIIFNAAMIPYVIFFLVKFFGEKDTVKSKNWPKSFFWLIVMALFYYGSIVVFSKASISLGDMGSVIAWPMLMIMIILTSNFWGWKQGEWHGAGKVAIKFQKLSILLLVIAILLLTVTGALNLK
jgi:L-rhamnose-H+ transport protein